MKASFQRRQSTPLAHKAAMRMTEVGHKRDISRRPVLMLSLCRAADPVWRAYALRVS